MGYVKKTITEAIGETSVTTTIEFETYEDFMTYEKSLNASQERFPVGQSLKIGVKGDVDFSKVKEISLPRKEPEWIDHDGSDECPVPEGSDCEVMFGDGRTERDSTPEQWAWWWFDPAVLDGADIVKYRVFN